MKRHSFIIFAAVVLFLQVFVVAGEVVVSVETSEQGAVIPENALGVSYEPRDLLADEEGNHYFSPENKPLLNMFKTLGIKNLRIGGSSVDLEEVAIPSIADLEALFEFARAANVKVIYTVRLKDGDPNSAAKQAKFIGEKYPDVIESFSIGNEPSYYKADGYKDYFPRWIAIRDAMASVYPEAKFSGPDQNPNKTLFKKVADKLGNDTYGLVQITVHSYPFGCSYKKHSRKVHYSEFVPYEAGASREKMLSSEAYEKYEKIHEGLVAAVAGNSLTYRLSETNSYWLSGLKGASDSYASALWVLDYLYWWTGHGAEGLNFHTGDMTSGTPMPCQYAAFVTSDEGYEARPLAYGMKMFDLGGKGRSLKTSVTGGLESNVAAYATAGDDKTLFVTVINKEYAKDAAEREIKIRLDSDAVAGSGEVIFLKAKNNDIATFAGDVTVGGAVIREDGVWDGKWESISVDGKDGAVIDLTMPRASAAVVRVKLK